MKVIRFSSLLLTLSIIAFATGRVFGQPVSCVIHQPSCTYTVLGCYQVSSMVCPGSQFGYSCYNEFGTCCPEGEGSDFSRFCSTGCDGSGGGSC